MSLMKINHLTFTYPSGTTPVFEDLTLQLDTTWKLGLIGRNGCGKSTLFKLLRGMYPYKGEIVCNTLLTSFPLSIPDPSLLTIDVLHDCYPSAEEWQLRRELNLMEVDADDLLWRPFETLSGGEQTKALLTGLFLDDAFALIDEPTNHLDLHGRELLARYLRRKRGFILISHDRHFLDGCVDHVLALGRSETRVFSGDYSTWQENAARRQTHEETQNARLQQEIRHLSKAAERSANWSHAVEKSKIGAADKGHVGHMAAKMMKRAKAIEARRERAIEEKRQLLKDVEHDQPLKLVPLAHHAEQLAIFENVQVRYDGRTIGQPQSFTVRLGDRLFLDGPNGCGKSSLLRLLVGAPIDHTGTYHLASGLIVSYVPQHAEGLSGSVHAFAASTQVDRTLFLSYLHKMGLPRRLFDQDMRTFSEGQKKKILLAKSLSEQAHLYVWDEPLNYIDLASRLQIEQLILSHRPTMLLVEHDRAFQDAVATKILSL